jgi:hypothetical protein
MLASGWFVPSVLLLCVQDPAPGVEPALSFARKGEVFRSTTKVHYHAPQESALRIDFRYEVELRWEVDNPTGGADFPLRLIGKVERLAGEGILPGEAEKVTFEWTQKVRTEAKVIPELRPLRKAFEAGVSVSVGSQGRLVSTGMLLELDGPFGDCTSASLGWLCTFPGKAVVPGETWKSADTSEKVAEVIASKIDSIAEMTATISSTFTSTSRVDARLWSKGRATTNFNVLAGRPVKCNGVYQHSVIFEDEQVVVTQEISSRIVE